MRGDWTRALRLEAPRPHDIQPADLAIAVCAFLVIPSVFYTLFTALEPSAATQPTSGPDGEVSLQVRTLAGVVGNLCAIAVLLLVGHRCFSGGLWGWGLTLAGIPMQIVRAVAVYIAVWPACFLILQVMTLILTIAGFELQAHTMIETLLDDSTPRCVAGSAIAAAVVLAPIVEELLFRGLLLPAMGRWLRSQWLGIIASAAVFGLIHLPLYQNVASLMLLGLVLGYVYVKSGSLTLVILVHAVFNAKTIVWLLLGARP